VNILNGYFRLIAAFALGVATVSGFAPFYLYPIPVVTLALLALAQEQDTWPGCADWIYLWHGPVWCGCNLALRQFA